MKKHFIFCFSTFLFPPIGAGPLHDAVLVENRTTILKLLAAGEDISAPDEFGRTALHIAIQRGYLLVAQYLVAHGASVSQPDARGGTPLHYAVQYPKSDSTELIAILLEKGAWVDAQDIAGNTPVHAVAAMGEADALFLLLKASPNLNLCDLGGRTAREKAHSRVTNYFQAIRLGDIAGQAMVRSAPDIASPREEEPSQSLPKKSSSLGVMHGIMSRLSPKKR